MKNPAYIFLAFFFLSCETIVDINIPVEPPSIVLNCTLSDKEYIKVNLTQSQHILDNTDYQPVSGATVEIYEDGKLLTQLPDSLGGNYISAEHIPSRGKTYSIKASKPGFETATSEVLLPLDTVNILNVKMDTLIENEFGYTSYYLRINIEFEDAAAMDNYYQIAVYHTGYYQRYDHSVDPPAYIDSIYFINKMFLQSRDPSLEEFQSYGQNILINDGLFNGKTYNIRVLMPFWVDLDSPLPEENDYNYFIEIANTSESYYYYKLSSQLQYWNSDNPFAQPVTVYNNIENGFGVFGAYNTSIVKVE